MFYKTVNMFTLPLWVTVYRDDFEERFDNHFEFIHWSTHGRVALPPNMEP